MKNKIKPTTLFIRVTENCNASCFMCGFANAKKQLYVSKTEITKIVDESVKAGIKLIRFTGGEPLLHPDIGWIIKKIKDKGIKTSLISNGFLLPKKYQQLLDMGLDQLILSLDGSTSEIHDKLRNLPGVFENLTEGIKLIRSQKGKLLIRINTVVSPFNIKDLKNIWKLISKIGVDQWSIIPLKSKDNLWMKMERKELLSIYKDFEKSILDVTSPKMLGYSKKWAGKTDKEVKKYFDTGVAATPKNECALAGVVNFYVPFGDRLTPCNCVSWRLKNVDFNTQFSLSALSDGSMSDLVEYLRINGPKTCQGCEPINSYLGDHPESIKKDLFSF